MKYLNYLFLILATLAMLAGAYNHVANPEFYNGMIPDFMPKLIVNYASAAVELIVGLLIIIPATRARGIAAFGLLMVAFLPIHIWDLTKDVPAIGSQQAAIIRLVVQFVLIAAAYWSYKALVRAGAKG